MDILKRIMESAKERTATGSDPEVEAKKCVEEIMKDLKEGKIPPEDMKGIEEIMEVISGAPMCIKIEGVPDRPAETQIQLTGYSLAIQCGAEILLENVAETLAENTGRDPERIVEDICNVVITELKDKKGERNEIPN